MIVMTRQCEVHPLAGVLAGVALTAACLVLPVSIPAGEISLVVPIAVALILIRPDPAKFLRLLGGTLVVYLPMLLVLPQASVAQGAATTLTGVTMLGTMGYPALHDAVTRLPLPAMVKLLLLQMLHQASVLLRETVKIRQAIVIRGAIPRGFGGWELLHALPRVWIPRVIFKANRVAHALEMRGYGSPVPPPRDRPWLAFDVLVFLLCATVLIATIVLRVMV